MNFNKRIFLKSKKFKYILGVTKGLIFFIFSTNLNAQQKADTSLAAVTVNAFELNKQLSETNAAIGLVNQNNLKQFNTNSIVQAVNTTSGVRMEERSPGSYRLSIRGSSQRSPFGVRNVKIYYNDIPLTDPGGNTYLNMLSPNLFNSISIIKGPAGSIYGAGNGGVLLINSNADVKKEFVKAKFQVGSYSNYQGLLQSSIHTKNMVHSVEVFVNHLNGYRQHSIQKQQTVSYNNQLVIGSKNTMYFTFLAGNLNYQTPGGLTRTEFEANPKAYRSATTTLPNANKAKAAVYQKQVLLSIKNNYRFRNSFSNTTVFYTSASNFKNPTFRNYETRTEPHFGGRSFFNYKLQSNKTTSNFTTGAEFQKGNFTNKTYVNNNGEKGNLQTHDNIKSNTGLVFAQADVNYNKQWNITLGMGINFYKLNIVRLHLINPKLHIRSFSKQLSPRIAISKKIFAGSWFYATAAKGFSPPTIAEVLPSNNVLNTFLNAENGNSYEAGLKLQLFKKQVYAEFIYFNYNLKNAIVQRRDSTNADYFINAGSTNQQGFEHQLQANIINNTNAAVSKLTIAAAYTYYNFRYKNFKQLTTDFMGKYLPGIPKNSTAININIHYKQKLQQHITFFNASKLFLNDINTEVSKSYTILGTKFNYYFTKLNVFAGIENLLNQHYSLGNDINAAGGKYFNAAPARNYYLGFEINLK